MSLIDVTSLWKISSKTILCVIASDYTSLQNTSDQTARKILTDELARFYPFVTSDNIERIDLQSHVKNPLFMNTAGAWPYRPKSSDQKSNLFICGDYTQTPVDLTCMEGAVSSGILAAIDIMDRDGINHCLSLKVPKSFPRFCFVILKFLLLPIAAIAFLIHKMRGSDED